MKIKWGRPCSYVRMLNICRMLVLPNLIYGFIIMSVKSVVTSPLSFLIVTICVLSLNYKTIYLSIILNLPENQVLVSLIFCIFKFVFYLLDFVLTFSIFVLLVSDFSPVSSKVFSALVTLLYLEF